MLDSKEAVVSRPASRMLSSSERMRVRSEVCERSSSRNTYRLVVESGLEAREAISDSIMPFINPGVVSRVMGKRAYGC